ncbi:MAG: gluconate 2-dehydrogenase subunit 3 family protein [Acidobacteria bacterium]|nr:gluconate 2-dehydrogenase subunit 3 family protein [Acidobacteriota bacterium]
MSESLSRREWLKRAAVAGAAAAVPVGALGAQRPEQQARAGTSFATLAAAEGETLEAITARLIPTDEHGPGATEARAARYIDHALGGALAASLAAYRGGLAALDRFAETAAGARFADIPADAQDAVLRAVEHGSAAGFAGSAAFFAMVRSHTIQGTFSDPAYGGNEDFVGWELIGYPGVRTAVTPELQRMDVAPPARHVSAYDYPAFAAARTRRTRGR